MAVLIDPDRSKLRAVLRLMQILRVLARHKFLVPCSAGDIGRRRRRYGKPSKNWG